MVADGVALSAVTALLSVGVVLYGVRVYRNDDIGAGKLGAFVVALGLDYLLTAVVVMGVAYYGVGSGAGLAALSVPLAVELFFVATTPLSGLLIVAAVFSWFRFVLTYTVRMEREEELAVLVLGVVVFAVATVNGLIGALSVFEYVSLPTVLENSIHQFVSLIEILITGVAIGAGVQQLYRASRRQHTFPRGAVVGLSVPILLAYLTRYVYQFGLVTDFGVIGAFRVGSLAVGFGGVWLAVERYGTFERLPASRSVGRETAFETVEAAIVVLNGDGRIVDLNPAAESLFSVSGETVVGEPATAVLPESTIGAEATTYEFPNGERVVEARTTATTDDQGREIGRTVVYTDITEERRRQQRIEVLNRVLRHNLRNDANAAAGYIEMAAEGGEESERYAEVARSKLDQLVDTGAKARTVEDMLAANAFDDPTELAALVESAAATAREEHGGEVSVTVPDGVSTSVNGRVLEPVVTELVANGLAHAGRADADGEAAVRVRFEPSANALVVADDGPGIPEVEVEVFESEQETPLRHGSGLGLWLVKWGVNSFGGDVRFDVSDAGSQVAVLLPAERVQRSE